MDKQLGSAAALVLGGLLLAAPTRRAELDHVGAYNFTVEIEGINAGYFKSVSGIGAEVEVITEGGRTPDGGEDRLLRKRPGRVKYGDITLKKGFVSDPALQAWWGNVRNGKEDPREVVIEVEQEGRAGADPEVRTWRLGGAFPKSWKVSSLDGKGNDVLTEEMVIVIEWFEEA